MDLKTVLRGVDLFEGLTASELEKVAGICKERRYQKDEYIARQGEHGNELFIITEGYVEVIIGEKSVGDNRVVINLGSGQITGEIALLDYGTRSASLRAGQSPTVVQVITREDFENLCQSDHHIGYVVMRNLAIDLSFKLRHRNLSVS